MKRFSSKCIPMLLWAIFSCVVGGCSDQKAEEIKVDLTKNAVKAQEVAPQVALPVLKIAVSAMISPKPTYDFYEDLLKHIGRKVNSEVEFVQNKTYEQTNAMLRNREIDLAFVCSGPYVDGKKDFGMELLVAPVVNGQKVYHSYFLVHKEAPYQSLNDLRGKTFAFTDPHSNTGCLVPTYVLAKRGETPESFFKETFYSYSHDNSIKMVAEGKANGCAVDSLIWEFMNHVDPKDTGRTKIIEKSLPYGIPPIVVHPDLNIEKKEQLRKAFLTLHEDEEGKAILNKLQIERFELGNDSDYDSIREMLIWLKDRKL